MITNAKKVDGGWKLNGSKMWISNSPVADMAVVWAKAYDGGAEDGVIRGFLIERDTPGFSTPKIKNKMSVRASPAGDIVLQDCFVPDDNVFSDARGLKGPFSCLHRSRFGIAWGTLGAAENCYHRARDYAMKRQQFGYPLASMQLIQTKLANMATDIIKMQLLSWRLGNLMNEDRATPGMISLAKRNNCGTALENRPPSERYARRKRNFRRIPCNSPRNES